MKKIGQLVRMKLYIDEPDEWGVGIVVEHDTPEAPPGEWINILWSKAGLSWERGTMVLSLHESR